MLAGNVIQLQKLKKFFLIFTGLVHIGVRKNRIPDESAPAVPQSVKQAEQPDPVILVQPQRQGSQPSEEIADSAGRFTFFDWLSMASTTIHPLFWYKSLLFSLE